MKNYGTIALGAVVATMCALTFSLFMQYRFFCDQANNMIAAKEDYQTHLVAVKRVLQEYNKMKEQIEQLQASGGEKKKLLARLNVEQASKFPKGAHVVSSDAQVERDDFVVINRELEYLKQSSLDYLKRQNLTVLTSRISKEEWKEYTDTLLEHNRQPKAKLARRNKAKKSIVASKKGAPEAEVSNSGSRIHDINFAWPVKRTNFWISSEFGPRKKPDGSPGFHYGIDLAAPRGTPIKPAAAGIVVEARNVSGYGKTIVVAHNRKYRTRYAHLDKILAKVGKRVDRSTIIGTVGHTGYVRSSHGRDASHLHFEVYAFGKQVNPRYFFA